ncbi:MAG: RHS repeat-associated core domain-containing protein [Phycisphaerae bacterium]
MARRPLRIQIIPIRIYSPAGDSILNGLDYYHDRYYNPSIGRFLQSDPVAYYDQTSWYPYCKNSPLRLAGFIRDSRLCWYGNMMRKTVPAPGNPGR